MTTAQEVPAHAFPPFPFFVENPVDPRANDLPANNNNHNSNLSHLQTDTRPLPDRCQFSFSDGRQCTMPRSEIHPSLCRFHAEREDQLFGDPAPSGVVGAALDLPELFSACRDLSTAAGVNRALAQVFRLLAQRRISRQEAATFCHLAQLLLRSIAAMRAEYVAAECGNTADPAFTKTSEAPAASRMDSKPTGAHRVFVQDSAEGNSARAGVIRSESVSPTEPATLTKPVIPSPPSAARFAADLAARRARNPSAVWPPAATPPEPASQIAQNQHLHKNGAQLTQNEHLQNCET
jgi:hypothetical protein